MHKTEEVSAAVAALPGMNKAQLLKLWEKTFPQPPVAGLRKELMVLLLAYRMQEAAHGGLSHGARKKLDALAGKKRKRQGKVDIAPPHSAKLLRSWHGTAHEVLVTDDGYVYQGELFRSLSAIAKRITGTHWSGPAFFATRSGKA